MENTNYLKSKENYVMKSQESLSTSIITNILLICDLYLCPLPPPIELSFLQSFFWNKICIHKYYTWNTQKLTAQFWQMDIAP